VAHGRNYTIYAGDYPAEGYEGPYTYREAQSMVKWMRKNLFRPDPDPRFFYIVKLSGKQNPHLRLPAKWTPAQVRTNSKGQVQLKINPAKLGTGSRFAACVRDMKSKGSAYDPYAVCASAGRRKYGKRKMAKWAAKGLRRAIKRAGGHRPNRMRRRY